MTTSVGGPTGLLISLSNFYPETPSMAFRVQANWKCDFHFAHNIKNSGFWYWQCLHGLHKFSSKNLRFWIKTI